MTKYIFITGGVVSSIGKGLTSASLGMLLKSRGLKVGIQKLDPYFNPDPSTLTPYQHGEIYVTDDGTETDLALGHYERFMNINLTAASSTTLGKIYRRVLDKEREGFYGGNTVQVIPHITNEVKDVIMHGLGEEAFDVMIVEIGGTVGDIESHALLETIRQIRQDLGRRNTLFIHIALVPYLHFAGEAKTKPVQHSAKHLRSIGIQPDIIVCRAEYPLDSNTTDKIALFCDIDKNAVLQHIDTDNLYEIPIRLAAQGFDTITVEKLQLECGERDISDWQQFYEKSLSAHIPVTIAVVGKYTELPDAYLSIFASLRHSAISDNAKLEPRLIDAEELNEENIDEKLAGVDGILIPDGFGIRGCSGMLKASAYARCHSIPFLGIGMGMHIALVDAARNLANMQDAHMPETKAKDGVMIFDSRNQIQEGEVGGTLEVGLLPCQVKPDTKLAAAYGAEVIYERHRHRYALKKAYQKQLEDYGVVFSGVSPDGSLLEVMELQNHPWFVGVQYHPEFKSRPEAPHPLFNAFMKAALNKK